LKAGVNQARASVDNQATPAPKSTHGGKRAGAGRKTSAAQMKALIEALNFSAFPAADRFAPGRSYVWSNLSTANKEHTQSTREEIARKALAFYASSGCAVRAIDGPARAAVSHGLTPYPCTSSSEFNNAVRLRFEQGPECDARFFDAARQVNYHEACDLLLRGADLMGDMFWQKLRASDGTTRARLVEGIFVGNARKVGAAFDEDQWTDGCRLDPLGAPIAWRVLQAPGSDVFTDVPADQLMQFKRTRRVGGVRGVSALAIVAANIHDLEDIVADVKAGYKIAAKFPFAFYSERGAGVFGTIDSSFNSTTGEETRTLKQRAGSGVLDLRPGEKVESMKNNVPGETFSPVTNEIRRQIAEGVGAPYNILYNLSEIGGANNRWALVEYQFLLDEKQWQLVSQFCRPWYQDWVWHEIEAGYFNGIAVPDDWYAVTFGTPAKPTVDAGRDGALLLKQIEAGFVEEDYAHGLFGRNPAEQDRMRFERAMRRRQMLADFNAKLPAGEEPFTPEEVWAHAPNTATPDNPTVADPGSAAAVAAAS
jgi:hypothetical protein